MAVRFMLLPFVFQGSKGVPLASPGRGHAAAWPQRVGWLSEKTESLLNASERTVLWRYPVLLP